MVLPLPPSIRAVLVVCLLSGCALTSRHAPAATLPDDADDLESIARQLDPSGVPLLRSAFSDEQTKILSAHLASPDAQSERLETHVNAHVARTEPILKDHRTRTAATLSAALGEILIATAEAETLSAPWTSALLERLYQRLDEGLGAVLELYDALPVMDASQRPARDAIRRLATLVHLRHNVLWAHVLRDKTPMPLLGITLANVEADAKGAQNFPLALAAAQARTRRLQPAKPDDWFDLSGLFYQTLHLAIGEQVQSQGLQTNRPVDPEVTERLTRLRESAGIVLAQTGNDLESRLRRANALMALEELKAAQKEYEAARAMAPKDARPVVGLAQLSVLPRGPAFKGPQRTSASMVERSATVFGPAQSLQPHDAEFVEMAAGLQALEAIYSADAAQRAAVHSLETLLTELAPQDVAEGRADSIRYLLQLLRPAIDGQPLVPGFARCHTDLKPLLKTHPESVLATQIRLGCALFTDRLDDALADALPPLPADSQQHHRIRQLQTVLALASKYGEPKLLDQLPVLVKQIHTRDPQQLAQLDAAQGDALALDATLRHRDQGWSQAEMAYQRALQRGPPQEDIARVLTNLGTVQSRLGKNDEAKKSWAMAAEVQPDQKTRARFAELVGTGDWGGPLTALDELDALETDTVFGESWRIWRVLAAQRAHDEAEAADEARDVVAYRKENLHSGALGGAPGAVIDRAFVVSLGWQYQYAKLPQGAHWLAEIGITPMVYLTRPPPITLAQIEALAMKAEKRDPAP